MKKMLSIFTRSWSGCLSLKDLQKYHKDELPKIGDTLKGEVLNEKEYGFFIKIAEQEHYHKCNLSGLLHKSNLQKGSFWSIGNKNIYEDYSTAVGREVMVEVIDITAKGYSLKEMNYVEAITVEVILSDPQLKTFQASKYVYKAQQDNDETSSRSYNQKIITESETIKKSPTYNACIFKNTLYIYMYSTSTAEHYFTKNLQQSITFYNGRVCFHKDFNIDAIDETKTWEYNEYIEKYNHDEYMAYKSYKNHLEEAVRKEKERKKLIENILKNPPIKTIKMYCAFYLSEDDKTWIVQRSRLYDNEKVLDIEIYFNENDKEEYFKIEDKFYKNNEEATLLNDECLICHGKWKRTSTLSSRILGTVYFKYGIKSDILVEKYQGYDIGYGTLEFWNLKQGESDPRPRRF